MVQGCEKMKKWETALVAGVFLLIIGVILMGWAFQALEPIRVEVHTHRNILGETIYDDVETSLDTFFIFPLLIGTGFIGVGLGLTGVVYDLYKLEKQIEKQKPQAQ